MIDALTPAQEAQLTAQRSMSEAACYVEDAFPEYPPELQSTIIAALVVASAGHEIAASLRAHSDETIEASEIVARSISGLHDALRTDHPLMGQTLDGVASGLKAIARAIQIQRTSDQY